MKKYNITVEEIYRKTIEVEANSQEEAEKLVEDMSYSNSYLMTPEDYVQDSFDIVSVDSGNKISFRYNKS